jgi:hypothetical protein
MGILEFILIVVIIIALLGGGFGYSRRADWGVAPSGILGLVVVIVLVILVPGSYRTDRPDVVSGDFAVHVHFPRSSGRTADFLEIDHVAWVDAFADR